MNRNIRSFFLTGAVSAVLLSGCVTGPQRAVKQQIGESVVCIGEEPAALAWRPVLKAHRVTSQHSTYKRLTGSWDWGVLAGHGATLEN